MLLFLTALMSCSLIRKAATYNSLDSFSSGLLTPSDVVLKGTLTGKPVFLPGEFVFDGEKRRAMITMADAKITFDVGEFGKGPRLALGTGMNSTIGDGAEGIITVDADGQSEVVYRRCIDPIDRSEDRKWFEESADLSKFAAKKVKISFGVGCGPKGDAMADWFAWTDLELNQEPAR